MALELVALEPMAVLDVLALAHAHLEHGWCQSRVAMRKGEEVSPDHPAADQWCAMGAIFTAVEEVGAQRQLEPIQRLALENAATRLVIDAIRSRATGYERHSATGIVALNNRSDQTKAGVQAIFEEAAQKVGKG